MTTPSPVPDLTHLLGDPAERVVERGQGSWRGVVEGSGTQHRHPRRHGTTTLGTQSITDGDAHT